jgi:hypothetical protein
MPIVKIVLGGIAGLGLGAVVVYLITGENFGGLLPGGNEQPKQQPIARVPISRPVTPKPIETKPYTPPALVPPSAPVTPFPSEPPPEASPGISSPPPTAPIETTPATSTPTTSTPMPPATPGNGGNSTNSTPASPPPTTAPAPTAPQNGRQQPPPTAEQQKMLAELQTIYKAEFERGTKPDGRVEFIAFLRKTARELKTEPVAQFVLWRQAYDVSLGQSDFASAADAIDELEVLFDVDGFRLRQHLLTQASQAAKRPDERAPLIPFALDLADYAIRAQKIEELTKLANIADSLARTADKDTRSQVTAKAAELRRAATDFAQVAAARTKLAQEPANPAASLIDGRFRCFVAGQWKVGLPLLAHSDHAALSAAAKQDLAGTTESIKAVQLGDAWFDLAAADPAMAGAYHRAGYWYRQAAETAQGLEKVKIDKRLEQIAVLNLPPQPAEDVAAPTLPTARALLTRAKTFERSDLLTAMTQETIRTQGWTISRGYIHVVSSAEYARIQSPVNPAGEYQTVLRVRRMSSSSQSRAGIFVVGLPHPRSQFLVVLDHPIPGRGMASFLTLGGLKRPEDNPTLKVQSGPTQLLQLGREQTLHCSVSMNEIKVTLDGQPLMEYRGDMSKLSVPREWAVPDARSLFLGSHQGSFSIAAWLLGPLRDAGGKDLPLDLPPSAMSPVPFIPQP